MASEIDTLDAEHKAILADLRDKFTGLRALNSASAPAPSFESAISLLTYAAGSVSETPPTTPEGLSRFYEQVSRLDAIGVKAHRAIHNKDFER